MNSGFYLLITKKKKIKNSIHHLKYYNFIVFKLYSFKLTFILVLSLLIVTFLNRK